MTSEKSKGSIKRLLYDDLPKSRVIFWDTNFVIDALFPPNVERKNELQTKADKTPLTSEESLEYKRIKFLEQRHGVSVDFLERLIKEKMNVAFSSILFTEVYFFCKYIELDKIYKDKEKTRVALKNNPRILLTHTPEILKKWDIFMELLSKFKSRIFAINPSEAIIIQEVLRMRYQYCLTPNDSFHVGTVLAGKHKDIIAFDKAVKNVALEEGVDVWWNIH